jgi:hypothetical protein
MRLVMLCYRLTKIKGVLVSLGICALTRATMFMGSAVGAAGLREPGWERQGAVGVLVP